MTAELLTVVGEFAATGRIGPLHVGLRWTELLTALRQLDLAPSPVAGPDFTDRFDSLDIAVADGHLDLLGLDHDGDLAFKLPPALGRDRSGLTLTRADVIAQLAQIGCGWAEDPALTFAGQQTALRTNADVSMVFARPSVLGVELADDEERLTSAYISLPRRAQVVDR
jgi:hypothetical protein